MGPARDAGVRAPRDARGTPSTDDSTGAVATTGAGDTPAAVSSAGLDTRAALQAEGAIIGRYLVGRVVSTELTERYADASRVLFTSSPTVREATLIQFVRRHPWSLKFLDAACGFVEPGGALRGRVLVMAAILEASPEGSGDFLPRSAGRIELLVRLGAYGLVAATRVLIGVILYASLARKRG